MYYVLLLGCTVRIQYPLFMNQIYSPTQFSFGPLQNIREKKILPHIFNRVNLYKSEIY